MGLGVAEGSEAPGDCLPDLGHADIALGAGVGERGVGVAAVRSTSVSYWVSASWGFSASDLAMRPRCPSRRAGGLFPCGLGEDGPGARAHGREGCLVEGLGVKFTDPAAGSAQEVAQALGPDVAVGVLDEPEVAQQVGTAQGVLPVGQGIVQAHQLGQQGRLGHGTSGQHLEGLGGALERHHVRGHEMRGEGQDAVAVLQRSRHVVGEGAPALGSAARAGRDLGLDRQLAGLEQDVHQDPPLMAVRGDVPKTATADSALGAHRAVRTQRLEVHQMRRDQRDQRLTQPRRRLGIEICVAHDPVQ